MLLIVLDGAGNPQTVISPGQEEVVDRTLVLADANPATLFAANEGRSGVFLQNLSGADIRVNDVGSASDQSAFIVSAGGTWPPANYPLSTGAISVSGQATALIVAREW